MIWEFYYQHKKLLVGILAILVLILLVGSVFLLTKKPDQKNSTKNPTQASISSVPITNLANYPTINQSFRPYLEENLYNQLKQSVKNILPSYYGVVRAGSISTSQTTQIVGDTSDIEVTVTVVHFIIDVPNAKRTYEAATFTDPSGQVFMSQILCPTKQENKYGDFACVNQL